MIEAEIDRAKGVLSTLLVQNGTLQVGDVVIAGNTYGRLRAMFDQRGRRMRKAGPSTPVSVMGLNDVPQAGDLFQVVESDRDAKSRKRSTRASAKRGLRAESKAISLEHLFDRYQSGEVRELRLVIKADVQGSLEPIVSSLNDMSRGEIRSIFCMPKPGISVRMMSCWHQPRMRS